MKAKVAYISGPISGFINGNIDAFSLAQDELQKQGYIVTNPHKIGKEIYEKWSKINVNTKELELEMWQEFMKNDIRQLTLCDVVFALDGWDTSPGARIEIFLALKLGLKVYSYKTMLKLEVDLNLTKGKPFVI